MKVEQRDEAVKILKIIEQYFPKRFDGMESVKWLHQHSNQGRQDEWAAFFFEEYSFPLLTNFLGGWKGPRITRDKRFDYQREFVWDLKLESNYDKNGKPSDWIILNDKDATDRIIKLESGIGFIIAKVNFSFDKTGSFRKWRLGFEKKPKKKTGPGKSRVLKENGMITEMLAIIIKDEKILEEGVKQGWIGMFNQGRNSDGSPRSPKYQISVKKTPKKFIVKLNEK